MGVTVKIEGLDAVMKAMESLPSQIAGKNGGPMLKALRRIGARVATDAKSRVLVDTGTLRDNIITSRIPKKRRQEGEDGVEVTVRYKAKGYKDNARNRRLGRVGGDYKNYGPLFYAKFLEFGTSKFQAHPFLTTAFEANKAAMPEMFKSEMARAIGEAVERLARKGLA